MIKLTPRLQVIYDTIPEYEYILMRDIISKSGVNETSVSPALTRLRELGVVSSPDGKGNVRKNKRRWRKHPLDSPLNPPQGNFIEPRKNAGTVILSAIDAMDALQGALDKATEAVLELEISIEKKVEEGVKKVYQKALNQ